MELLVQLGDTAAGRTECGSSIDWVLDESEGLFCQSSGKTRELIYIVEVCRQFGLDNGVFSCSGYYQYVWSR